MLLGKRIKKLRREKGLTQQELGDLINVTKVSICCYEKETRVPTLETLTALAKVFKVDINYFLGNDYNVVADNMKSAIMNALDELSKKSPEVLKEERYNKFRKMGRFVE